MLCGQDTVYPRKYAHGFVVLCFVVVMESFRINSHEVFNHIHQGCFAGTGAIVRLPQCQWSKPDGYGKISQCITTTKHSKAKTVCIFLWIYCKLLMNWWLFLSFENEKLEIHWMADVYNDSFMVNLHYFRKHKCQQNIEISVFNLPHGWLMCRYKYIVYFMSNRCHTLEMNKYNDCKNSRAYLHWLPYIA